MDLEAEAEKLATRISHGGGDIAPETIHDLLRNARGDGIKMAYRYIDDHGIGWGEWNPDDEVVEQVVEYEQARASGDD